MNIEHAPLTVPPGVEAVEIALGDRSYPIVIGPGLLQDAPRYLEYVLPKSRFAIVADRAVLPYAETLHENLKVAAMMIGEPILVTPGEASKSFSSLEEVCSGLLDLGLERKHGVIAVGGGVVGDLAGFAAAIVKRGVPLVQVPTTLLAQVDSSVGGKTGINTRHGKNLLGAFHQPSLVLADTDTLETLPRREFRSGFAEVVKYGVLGDAHFFAWLEDNRATLFERDRASIAHAVAHSCVMKGDIVARDEREMGERALLNLGHTFGHAVEAWAGYTGAVLHGEAVALGMVLAAEFSHQIGACPQEAAPRIASLLAAAGFATTLGEVSNRVGRKPDAAQLLSFMEQDKKIDGGEMTLILIQDIGEAFVAKRVARGAVETFLRDRLSA